MKTTFAVFVALVVGLAAGITMATIRAGGSVGAADGSSENEGYVRPSSLSNDTPLPKVVVDNPDYDFGTMDMQAEGRHDFIFTNAGDAPLRLTTGDTSCRCTLSKLEREEVMPGDSTKVTLTWTAKDITGPFRQTAHIETTDPRQPRVELTISGNVTVATRVIPGEVVFSSLSPDQTDTADVRIFGFIGQPLEIIDYQSTDPDSAGNFDVVLTELPPEQIEEEPHAQSGVLMRVTVKPGLPQGPFQQKIRLRTNVESTPEIFIPISGTVRGRISVVGPGYSPTTGILDLGTIRQDAGVRRRLLLVVHGPHRKEIKFEPVSVYPDLLKVELGTPKPLGEGDVMQTPLVVEVPQGSRPAHHLNPDHGRLGEIILKTNHPDMPRLRIRVRFAVEG